MKHLDYYYLVLLRGYDGKLDYTVTYIMTVTFLLHFFTVFLLFNRHLFKNNAQWVGLIVIVGGIGINWILDMIYNKNRKKKIREKYKDESLESRRRGAAWVWFYEIVSILFLILAISMVELPQMNSY